MPVQQPTPWCSRDHYFADRRVLCSLDVGAHELSRDGREIHVAHWRSSQTNEIFTVVWTDPRRQRALKEYAAAPVAVMCMHCAEPVENHPDGRPKLYCSTRCRTAAHRAAKKAQLTAERACS
jgi:hypothetical protein